MEAFADDKIIVTQKLKFSPFPQCFQKLSFPEVLKVGIVWKWVTPVLRTIFFPSHWLLFNITIVETTDSGERGMNPVTITIINPQKEYWPSRGSNQRPPVLKSATLQTELWGSASIWDSPNFIARQCLSVLIIRKRTELIYERSTWKNEEIPMYLLKRGNIVRDSYNESLEWLKWAIW